VDRRVEGRGAGSLPVLVLEHSEATRLDQGIEAKIVAQGAILRPRVIAQPIHIIR
jgi:hypothetical protein